MTEQKECPVCRKLFVALDGQMYCSVVCRRKAYRARRAESGRPVVRRSAHRPGVRMQ